MENVLFDAAVDSALTYLLVAFSSRPTGELLEIQMLVGHCGRTWRMGYTGTKP
jgi:hypothetical protein